MELLAAYDPYVVFSLCVALLLTLCVGVLFLMRDPYAVPPHQMSRTVWCPEHHRGAHVDFVEWANTGMVNRSVRRCSLRGSDGSCNEECRHASA
ncbi:MAG TPA: hypothetical protein VMW56_24315 [Candidatus Margulisiibacteriota bacterium]|nr:hypothetical protein [Candidatus Margulisiibacteriota bacterium]